MKKIFKKISLMLVVFCSLFTMFVSESINVSAEESTNYVSTFQIKDSLKGYIWENGNVGNFSAKRKDIYFFNFPELDNEVIGDLNSITIDYTICKFKFATWCVIESDFRRDTIKKEDSLLVDLFMGHVAVHTADFTTKVNSVGKVSALIELDKQATEKGIIGGLVSDYAGEEKDIWQDNYEYYFIMPTIDSPQTLIISANIYNKLNGKNEEWECVGKSCLIYDEYTGADLLDKIVEFINSIIDFFKDNIWLVYVILFLLAYPIIILVIRLVATLFKIIMIPINLIVAIFDRVNDNTRERRRKRKEKERIERLVEERERKIIENTRYNDKDFNKYKKY